MAKLSIQGGKTSQSVTVFIQDSSKFDGSGLTGLAHNSSSLSAYYTFNGANTAATQITLDTLPAANSAWSSGGFKEIDAVNVPGVYRLDLPDAALTAGRKSVIVMLKGAANMAPCVFEIELTAWDNQNATSGGMANIDAAISTRLAASSYAAPDNASITAIKAKTDNLPSDPADESLIIAATDSLATAITALPTANQNADALLDRANGVETGYTLRQAHRLLLSGMAGKVAGAATTTVTIRDVNDTKNRITATVDSSGNRTALTIDAT
jgi:hypothetical protein